MKLQRKTSKTKPWTDFWLNLGQIFDSKKAKSRTDSWLYSKNVCIYAHVCRERDREREREREQERDKCSFIVEHCSTCRDASRILETLNIDRSNKFPPAMLSRVWHVRRRRTQHPWLCHWQRQVTDSLQASRSWAKTQQLKHLVGPKPFLGACAMTTKFLDNQICTFKSLLSWCSPRNEKKKKKKQRFGRFSSLPPRTPPPLQKVKI